MIKPLRKRHVQIWTGIAILLPVGMICAWLVVPKPVKDHLWQPASTVALPVIIKSVTKENYSVNLRTNKTVPQFSWNGSINSHLHRRQPLFMSCLSLKQVSTLKMRT